jgi:hypothetical protein
MVEITNAVAAHDVLLPENLLHKTLPTLSGRTYVVILPYLF